MVIVQLLGGLGNQMFQYAFGKALSVRNNSVLKVDTSILLDHRPGVHAVNRNFDLDIFDVHIAKASSLEIWRYNTHALSIPLKIAGRFYKMIAKDLTIRDNGKHYDGRIFQKSGDLYFSGTWQSYRYFEAIEDIIRREFRFKFPYNAMTQGMADRISATKAVCMNVRRTDYITVETSRAIFPFVGVEYYERAVAYLDSKVSDLVYYIFSDDIEWCYENFSFIKDRAVFVDERYAGPKFSHKLKLMASCDHFIIPNSTFAWWAAWLSISQDKIVIAPKKWMHDPSFQTNDLIPETWIKL